MKRSERMAWTGLAGLLAIGILLLIGGVSYNTTTFWAGMLVAFGQALVVGLAGWGLSLARQRAELEAESMPSDVSGGGFRMSTETEAAGAMVPGPLDAQAEIKTLDTGFQRMLVGITGVLLLGIGVGIGYMMDLSFAWARAHPDEPFPIAGAFGKPKVMDSLALVIGLGAAGLYVVLFWMTRSRRGEARAAGEAVNSNFALGVCGMIALGAATVLGFLNVERAAEVAAAIMAFFAALQGLELVVNAFRSFSAVEELDQEAVDLHALPLVPMLGSVWLGGLKLLFVQSVGLSQTKERGVVARMMPRAIGALILIGIFISCLRVVGPGEVAVLERLGYAPREAGPDGVMRVAKSAILQPGLHLTLPWPIDMLVRIPTQDIQTTNVGAPLHAPKGELAKVDFQFWTVRTEGVTKGEDNEDQFVTGEPSAPQMLETFVTVKWRVADPAQFYTNLSHSAFFEKKEGAETKTLPIYAELVQQCTSFAVTRTFAIHTLDYMMTDGRQEVEMHCKALLQEKLEEVRSGIQVVDLTIMDLHPPYGIGRVRDPSVPGGYRLGPAHAYENVTSMREYRETQRNYGEAYKLGKIDRAKGDAAAAVAKANGYKADVIAKAQGDAARMVATMSGLESESAPERAFTLRLAQTQAFYRALKDALGSVNKIIVDPQRSKDVNVYQTTDKGGQPPTRPPG